MNWFKNRKVGTKMIIGFLLVAIIAGAIGVYGIVSLQKITANSDDMYHKDTVPLGDMVMITGAFQRIRVNAKDTFLAQTLADNDAAEAEVDKWVEEFNTALDAYGKTLETDEEEELVADMREAFDTYLTNCETVFAYNRVGRQDDSQELMRGVINDMRLRIESDYQRLKEIKIEDGENDIANNDATGRSTIVILVVILACGMALSIILGILISRMITRPMQKLLDASSSWRGDLILNIDVDTTDEVNKLSEAFRRHGQPGQRSR